MKQAHNGMDSPVQVQAEQEDEERIEDLVVRVRADVVHLANELLTSTAQLVNVTAQGMWCI